MTAVGNAVFDATGVRVWRPSDAAGRTADGVKSGNKGHTYPQVRSVLPRGR